MTQKQQNPEIPAPVLGATCSYGHDYAQRSEIVNGKVAMIVFCPSCEGSGLTAPATAAQ